MIDLRNRDGELIAHYSDSFTMLLATQDAMERGYLPSWYTAVWPAAAGVTNQCVIVGIDYSGTVECTGYTLEAS